MSTKKAHASVSQKDIIGRMKSVSGLKTKEIASQIFDISSNNLYNQMRRDTLDYKVIISWAAYEKVNLNWLLTGEGNPLVTDTEKLSSENVVDMSHCDLVKTFKNKKPAREINVILKKIEDLDETKLFETLGYLRNELKHLQEEKESDIKKSQRTGS